MSAQYFSFNFSIKNNFVAHIVHDSLSYDDAYICLTKISIFNNLTAQILCHYLDFSLFYMMNMYYHIIIEKNETYRT